MADSADEKKLVRLFERPGIEISVHVNAAERPFNRVNFAVLVAIQLLKVIMRELRRLGIGHTGSLSMRARIISLRIFENTIMDEIHSWLHHDGFTRHFLESLDDAMRFPSGLPKLIMYCFGCFSRRKRLGLWLW